MDYADDVSLLAEMLEVLILSLEIMQKPVLLAWGNTQNPDNSSSACSGGWQKHYSVDIVESNTYLDSLIDRSGSCEAEMVRRIAIARLID